MTFALHQQAVQKPTFSPRLQHAVRLLQMSAMDYADALQQAADDNPFLELDREMPDDAAPGAIEGDDAAVASALDRLSATSTASLSSRQSGESDDMLQGVAAHTSLHAHLHAQLGVLRLSATERAVTEWVIEAIDDDGYLRVALDEIADAMHSGKPDADTHVALRIALCRVQSFDPPGVAARSVAECLALQLPIIASEAVRDVAAHILADHLDLLATRNIARLAAAMGLPVGQVQEAVEAIRHLDARPGSRFSDAAATAVTPDVLVRKVRGKWTAVLNDAAVPRLKLNRTYAGLFERHGGREHAEMGACLERARWTVQNLEQRVSTILSVAEEIVARQKLFLEHGPLAMKPLMLRDIADAVGVHPSTVSRTVNSKFMATPAGVFELRFFFSRGLEHASGGESAPTAIKELIREMVLAESSRTPLSDAEIARQLAQQGFSIARRTVTKYRQALGVDSVDCRRRA